MKLNQRTDAPAGSKDAFHVAAVRVTCKESLRPGDWVRFLNGSLQEVELSNRHTSNGIIDPWSDPIPAGTPVWMFLNPEMVGELTHSFAIRFPAASPVSLQGAIEAARGGPAPIARTGFA